MPMCQCLKKCLAFILALRSEQNKDNMRRLSVPIVYLLICSVTGLNLAPFFTADMNQHTILENTPVGTVIYTLKGEDPEGSSVRFGLKGTDKLAVDPVTGEVRVEKDIDRESRTDFNDNEIRFMVIIEVRRTLKVFILNKFCFINTN